MPCGRARGHASLWFQESVARLQHRVEHRFVEQCAAHPFRDDDIDVLDIIQEGDLFNFSANDAVLA
jgi:hypothetical protein